MFSSHLHRFTSSELMRHSGPASQLGIVLPLRESRITTGGSIHVTKERLVHEVAKLMVEQVLQCELYTMLGNIGFPNQLGHSV